VRCEPKSAINLFGELKEGYVRLEATLYSWYLRLYCKKITSSSHARHRAHLPVDMHIQRQHPFEECVADIPELRVDGVSDF
jgi:hypothetical protein